MYRVAMKSGSLSELRHNGFSDTAALCDVRRGAGGASHTVCRSVCFGLLAVDARRGCSIPASPCLCLFCVASGYL